MGLEDNAPSPPPSNDPYKDDDKRNEILLDLAKSRYDIEWQRTTELDDKAGSLIGYITIVTGLLVGLGTFSLLEKFSAPLYYIPYFVGIGFLLIAVLLSLFAIRTRVFYSSPRLQDLEKFYDKRYAHQEITTNIIPTIIRGINDNSNINNSKANFISKSWISLVIGIGAIVVYSGIIVGTYHFDQPVEFQIKVNSNSNAIKELINSFHAGSNNFTVSIDLAKAYKSTV